MTAEKVQLEGNKLTLLVTLYGKAIDSRSRHPILGDTYADEVLGRLDYDFKRLRIPGGADISLPVRAKHLDGWTRVFLAAHPGATVLHLGCGLDSRVLRVAPPPGVRWYDIDFPDVIALRRRVYPERAGYTMVGASVTNADWLERVPRDRPVFVVGEGLVQYLTPMDGIAMFRRFVDGFPSGELAFDAYSRFVVRTTRLLPAAREANVRLSWAIDDPQQLVREIPGLTLTDDVPFLTLPELVERLPRWRRAILRLAGRLPVVAHAIRHLRYRF